MTTNTTLEQIADQIAHSEVTDDPESLKDLILSALRNERERAALICEQGALLASPVGVIPAGDPEHERLQRLSDVLNSAARTIREGR